LLVAVTARAKSIGSISFSSAKKRAVWTIRAGSFIFCFRIGAGDMYGQSVSLAGHLSVFESYHAGKRDIKAVVQDDSCLLSGAAEAVKNHALEPAFDVDELLQNINRFLERLPAVYNYRQIQLAGDFQLCLEDPPLVLPG